MSVMTPQLDWDRAVRLKRIVYMFMGSMIVKETAYAIGMLALQDLLNFIGRAYAYEPEKTPIRLIVDEVGRLAFPGFIDLLAQAGGQGLMAVLAFQSVADLVSGLGPAGAHAWSSLALLHHVVSAKTWPTLARRDCGTCSRLLLRGTARNPQARSRRRSAAPTKQASNGPSLPSPCVPTARPAYCCRPSMS